MDAAPELGRDPVSKHQIQPGYGDENADAGRDYRTRHARPNSKAQTRTGKHSFSLLADHEQDWQNHPVDLYSCYMCKNRGLRQDCFVLGGMGIIVMPTMTYALSAGLSGTRFPPSTILRKTPAVPFS